PSPTGSAAADEARGYCADVLRNLGFSVVARPFEYSAFPGSVATPLAGLWLALAVSSVTGPVLIVAIVVLVVAARYFAHEGVLSFRLMRRRGVNLEATRSDQTRVWLVAHVDSKWQPVPTMLRVAGIILLGLATLGAVVLSVVQMRADVARGAWPWLVGLTWIAALPVILTLVGSRGP